jgi:inner membrane protein YidH
MEGKTNTGAAHVPDNTELALERTLMAHERTLMAWVRTSISMISFGFTIYKVFQEFSKTPQGQYQVFTPRVVGMTMIVFGLLALTLAQVQHTIAVRRIRKVYQGGPRSISSVISILILMFGLLLFFGALLRQ